MQYIAKLINHLVIYSYIGANPNAKEVNGLTPLHLAVYHGRTSCAEVLLSSGCIVDARTRYILYWL